MKMILKRGERVLNVVDFDNDKVISSTKHEPIKIDDNKEEICEGVVKRTSNGLINIIPSEEIEINDQSELPDIDSINNKNEEDTDNITEGVQNTDEKVEQPSEDLPVEVIDDKDLIVFRTGTGQFNSRVIDQNNFKDNILLNAIRNNIMI